MQIELTGQRIIRGIILVFALILLGYLISYYAHNLHSPRPKLTFAIKYKEVPPIAQNFPRIKIKVYYRGLSVGEVSKITLSDNQKYIVFYVNIYYKDLKLPKNIYIELDTEDLYGARHFEFDYPQNPSSEIIKDGDVVYGDVAYERIDQVLVKDIYHGKTGKILSNLVVMTDSLRNLTGNLPAKDSHQLMSSIKKSSNDVQLILRDFRQILDDPEVKQEIKSLIKSSSGTLRSINQMLESREIRQTVYQAPSFIIKTVSSLGSISENMPKVNENLNRTNYALPEVNKTVTTTNDLLYGTNNLLYGTDCMLYSLNSKIPQIPDIPPDIFFNANKALKQGNCLLDAAPEVLSQRALGLKLIFGQPGAPFKRCIKHNCHCGCY